MLVYSILFLLVIMTAAAVMMKPGSIYANQPEEQNPLEGKKVRFAANEADPENADGVRGHLEIIGLSSHKAGFYERVVKRCLDILFSFAGMVILLPVFLILSLWIVVDDPGPVFFKQKRVGKNKRYFVLHKFRTMKVSTPSNVPTHRMTNPHQYTINSGRFIRAHSLDELPQLWDIFLGNMSLIGPRPALWNQDLLIAERDKYEANDITPGLTGWAQINGRDELSIPAKAKLDGVYKKKISFKMDVICILRSLHVFVKDDTIVEADEKKTNQKENGG
jgi:O-antigen biosynthesis protein WbqP